MAVGATRRAIFLSTGRQLIGPLPRPVTAAVYAAPQTLVDKAVAFGAGGRDVGGMERRARIVRFVDGVGVVAIRTDRRDQEPRTLQAAAMNAFGERLAVLVVAATTEFHLMVQEDSGAAVVGREERVLDLAVAFLA